MQRSKLIAVAFYLGALVIGAAIGITIDRSMVRGWSPPRGQDPRAAREQVFRDLKLTDAQRAAWDSARREAQFADSVLMAPVWAAAAPLRPREDSIRTALTAKLRALLTPEQQDLFDKRQQARRPRPGAPNPSGHR